MVPTFTADRLTGEVPSFSPAASPWVRRRPSPWPPGRPDSPASESLELTLGRALRPGPDPPGWSRFWTCGGSTTGSYTRTPSRLACRTQAVWWCRPVPSLSGLLPSSPAPPGLDCPQLQRTAAMVRWRGPLIPSRFSSASWRTIGFQYTPVLSIATWVAPCSASQSARASRSSVIVPKVRIAC
jgi:hypothetical protein